MTKGGETKKGKQTVSTLGAEVSLLVDNEGSLCLRGFGLGFLGHIYKKKTTKKTKKRLKKEVTKKRNSYGTSF